MLERSRENVYDFVKVAAKLPFTPASVSDTVQGGMRRASRMPKWSQPTAVAPATRPDLVATQKAVPPPPVS